MTAERAGSLLPHTYLPRIHCAEVVEVLRPGPGLVRIRFGGADLRDFPSTGVGDEYVRMFFPAVPGAEVVMPRITSLRGWEYPDGVTPGPMRVYTIRAHAPGEILVDFVVHQGGVAADWAMQAHPGQIVAVNPPCELYRRPAQLQQQILVADEPGLPAALRIAELTAERVQTLVLCEVRGPEYRVFADTDAVQYQWLDGFGNGQRDSGVLAALRELRPAADSYVWVATEGKSNRAIRKYLRHEQQLPGENYTCVAYWQERAEAWRARLAELGPGFEQKLRQLRSNPGLDSEEINDRIATLYDSAGL